MLRWQHEEVLLVYLLSLFQYYHLTSATTGISSGDMKHLDGQ